jgi:putative ABC transport system ATP-binding protein
MLKASHVVKTYKSGEKSLTILNDVSFSIQETETISIIGPSGSGKTTLLGLCAGLDSISSGSIALDGTILGTLSQDELAIFRNKTLGFVFQNFQLVPSLSALENVMLPAEFLRANNIRSRAEKWLTRVGLSHRLDHYPSQLSGGEQQRVALARAFINTPKILFADEPTGNLDEETSDTILELLFELNSENKTTLVIVTHDRELAAKTGRILSLKGGQIASDVSNEGI